jgi:hypothetical protein
MTRISTSVRSRMFIGFLDPGPKLFDRIRILHSTSKKINKNLDFCFLINSSLKTDVKVGYLQKVISKTN